MLPSTCSPTRTMACWSGPSASAAPRWRSCSPREPSPAAGRADAHRRERAEAERWLQRCRGRDREGALRALPARRAQGNGQGQARPYDRRRRRRLATGQGGRHCRRADPRRSTTATSCASSGTAQGSPPPRSVAWLASSPRTRRASGARRTPAAGALDATSSGLRCGPSSSSRSTSTSLRRAHPPRRQAASLARGQGAASVRLRPALHVSRGPLALDSEDGER